MKSKTVLFVVLLSIVTAVEARRKPLPTVSYVDIHRYLGTWYEIARFDQKFQRGCTATEANYSLRDDGDLRVINRCNLNSPGGELKESEGRAWIKDKKTNSKLRVQFFLRGLRFFLFAGNYWIIDLDSEYGHVMVGDPSRKYLWILSRDKTLEEETYNRLVTKAKKLGFDTSKLLITEH